MVLVSIVNCIAAIRAGADGMFNLPSISICITFIYLGSTSIHMPIGKGHACLLTVTRRAVMGWSRGTESSTLPLQREHRTVRGREATLMTHLGVTIVLCGVLLCAGVTSVSKHNNDTMIEPRSY